MFTLNFLIEPPRELRPLITSARRFTCSARKLNWPRKNPALEMLRVALVTILAREMRLKYFEVDQRLEMLRVALVTILAREMRLKVFSTLSGAKLPIT